MKSVELWGIESDSFCGLIIPYKSGITWSNQVGGTGCFHPSVEGIFLPLPFDIISRKDIFLGDWITSYEKKFAPKVQLFLEDAGLDPWFESVESSELDIGEAWIPIRIKKTQPKNSREELYGAFAGMEAIITYVNSD